MESAKTLTASQPTMNEGLGFFAAAVRVDNLTSSYVRLTDAGVGDVPPWVWGVVVPLPVGVRSARAQLVVTTPAIPGPPVPSQQATLTWTDLPLPPAAGHLLQQSTVTGQQVIGQQPAPTGGTLAGNFTIPAGMLAIGFAVRTTGGNLRPLLVIVTGNQTGLQYFSTIPGSTTVLAATLDTTDTSVNVSVQAQGGGPALVDVLAWPVLPVTAVRTNPGDQLPTTLNGFGAAVPVDTGGGLGATPAQVVSLNGSTPPTWLTANVMVDIATAIASGGKFNAIAASGVKVIRLLRMQFTVDAVGAAGSDVRFFDGDPSSGGADKGRIGTNVQPPPLDFAGFPLTAGNGFWLFNGGAASVTIRGTLTANQT